jgi:hypothetical protein
MTFNRPHPGNSIFSGRALPPRPQIFPAGGDPPPRYGLPAFLRPCRHPQPAGSLPEPAATNYAQLHGCATKYQRSREGMAAEQSSVSTMTWQKHSIR